MTLHVVATIPTDPARTAESGPALAALAEASRNEEGCRRYDVYASSTPGVFVTIEEWDSQEALDNHMTQPHVAQAFETFGPLITGDLQIHTLSPV